MMKKSICDTLRRTCLILAGSFIMAVNLKSFVRTGGLIPGGFNGLTRLIQEISALLWHWEPPFSVINFILNAIPAIISFKFIGKKFTGYSRDEKSRTFSSNSKRSHILRTSSRSRRLILSSIVSFAVWLKCTRTI